MKEFSFFGSGRPMTETITSTHGMICCLGIWSRQQDFNLYELNHRWLKEKQQLNSGQQRLILHQQDSSISGHTERNNSLGSGLMDGAHPLLWSHDTLGLTADGD